LFQGGCYLEGAHQKLVLILDCWGPDRSLLTGGHCSEVVVSTGLTVFAKFVFE